MKTLIRSILITAGALSCALPPAHAGFDSGNAGDALAAEFIYSARDVLQRLELAEAAGHPVYPTNKLREAMEITTVSTLDRVEVNGIERDAANYPAKKLIELSRPRWRQYRSSSETFARLRLSLHEYLWITQVSDEHYEVSERILRALNVPNYSANVWLNLPGTAFAIVECTGKTGRGDFVTVQVNTKGAANTAEMAEVRVERAANKFGYRFKAADVSQFFESDDERENTAMVGLGAYVDREYPVSIKYSGKNFVDMDLRAVIDAGGDLGKGNLMKVWKGPGFAGDEQFVLHSPVCSIYSNN